MAIGGLLELPGVTQDQYDQVVSGLTDGGSLDSLSDWPVPGVLAHLAGPTGAGWRVCGSPRRRSGASASS